MKVEIPFANGTEGDAWMRVWCRYCTHDHGVHGDNLGRGCDLIMNALLHEPMPGGEAWIAEPDDGQFYLPSRMICLAFKPCEPCGGDPGVEDRAQRVAEVTSYWRDKAGQR